MKKEAFKLYIKKYGSKTVINSLKVEKLSKYLPSKEALIGHMEFQRLKVQQGLSPAPMDITVGDIDKPAIIKSLIAKGYGKQEHYQIPMFSGVNNTIPIAILHI